MFKLMSLLAAGMFLTLLIGGEDHGQKRQGLVGVDPVSRPVLREVAATTKTPKPDVTLANFAPVTVQPPKPQKAVQSAPIAGAFVVMEAEEPAVEPVIAKVEPETLPVLYVNSKSVNVRGGPSTDYEVVGRLVRAEAVTVVSAAVDGWVQIRIEGDGVEGFIAARLLTDTDPAN